jgi:Tfp pilus assembly protein PilF
MRARTFMRLILVALAACAADAFAVDPDVPHHFLRVGVVQTNDSAQIARVITNTLEGAGYQVEVLSSADSPARDWLADRTDLDAVVRASWDAPAKEATALLYTHGSKAPRWVRQTGDNAPRAAAASILELLAEATSTLPISADTTAPALSGTAAVRNDVLAALRLMSASKYSEALPLLQKALAAEPSDVQILYNLSLCEQKLGRTAEMHRYLNEAYRIDPRNGAVNILLGNERLARGQLSDAVAYYEIAKQSPGTSSLASWNLAVAYSQMGRADKVSEQLKAVSITSTQALETRKWQALIDEKVEAERRASIQRTRLLAWVASGGFAALAVTLSILLWRLVKQAKLTKRERALQLLPTVGSAVLSILSALLPLLLAKMGS